MSSEFGSGCGLTKPGTTTIHLTLFGTGHKELMQYTTALEKEVGTIHDRMKAERQRRKAQNADTKARQNVKRLEDILSSRNDIEVKDMEDIDSLRILKAKTGWNKAIHIHSNSEANLTDLHAEAVNAGFTDLHTALIP